MPSDPLTPAELETISRCLVFCEASGNSKAWIDIYSLRRLYDSLIAAQAEIERLRKELASDWVTFEPATAGAKQ